MLVNPSSSNYSRLLAIGLLLQLLMEGLTDLGKLAGRFDLPDHDLSLPSQHPSAFLGDTRGDAAR
jgi:hypothetical protein